MSIMENSNMESCMEWPDEFTLRLISLYQDKPILWNPTNKDFKMVNKKLTCWMDIAEELQMDVTVVKKKIDSLRTSFRRELRRERTTGMGNDGYHSKWFAFKSMQFLNKHVRHRKRINNIASPLSQFEEDITDDESIKSDHTNRSPSTTNSVLNNPVEVVKGKTSESQKLLKKQDDQEDPQVDEACKVFKIIAENKNALTEKDECISFGEYVTTQLKKFDSHTRAIAKHLIQNTLFEAEMGKLQQNFRRPASILRRFRK
ncbi:Hypothetical protein CINCED_3A016423 [Cinara cedri]|uniref:MADF domain-containing protein n=1 Tax=Cinara cedri TaxID=506608 RepID=A0A5E4NNH1_9HEMI|nr:Hypothetical protein CINCED_3A016423 [Cinara cedri]